MGSALFPWHGCLEQLRRRLEEPRPSRIQLLTGPRQVGKATLLLARMGAFRAPCGGGRSGGRRCPASGVAAS